MTATAAQIRFVAEFVTFVVATAGLALVVLPAEANTERQRERRVLAFGFLAMAAAAFGRGSLLFPGDFQRVMVGIRIAGIAGIGVGSLWWRGGRLARRALRVGLSGTAIAVGLGAVGAGRASDALLAAGSLVVGVSLLVASRRSVSARVAASAASTLLLVVLVLSLALSAVLSSSIQREELIRLKGRATTEAALATGAFSNEVASARAAAAVLLVTGSKTDLTVPQVQKILDDLNDPGPTGDLMYLLPTGGPADAGGGGRIIAFTKGLNSATAIELAGTPPAAQPACSKLDRGSAEVIGNTVRAVAVYSICQPDSAVPVGIVLRDRPLDNAYLEERHKDDPSLSLAIAERGARSPVQIKIGPQPQPAGLAAVVASVALNHRPTDKVAGNWYLAAAPILTTDTQGPGQGQGQVVAALVVSTPTSTIVSTRVRLFRSLFLVAMAGTLLALGLAVVIGDRITAGLRRLTLAAEGVQRGERAARSGITGDDEVGVLGAAFDLMVDSIDQQSRALQAAADDESRLRDRLEGVVAGMGDALVAVDASGVITDFNHAAEDLTGVSSSAAVGRPIDRVMTLIDDAGVSLATRLRTPSPSRWAQLATAVQPGGLEVPVALSAGGLRGPESELTGHVLVIRDLRREREVERMKTEFLSRVGHELRTPITGIMGYADMLFRRPVPADRAHVWHEEILMSAKRLLRIVEMLEFFASSGAGRVQLCSEPIDVRQLVEGVVATWANRLTGPSAISSYVAEPIPEINGDRRWLALAIDELINNAVKFSPHQAQVMVSAVITSDQVVEISVRDHGKGMTPQEQATAFGDFVQGDSSDTRPFGGLGLGLSLIQRVADGHGGTVRFSSLPGRGSTFTIVLPLTPVES